MGATIESADEVRAWCKECTFRVRWSVIRRMWIVVDTAHAADFDGLRYSEFCRAYAGKFFHTPVRRRPAAR